MVPLASVRLFGYSRQIVESKKFTKGGPIRKSAVQNNITAGIFDIEAQAEFAVSDTETLLCG